MSTIDLVMPKMGESIMEATILKWHKKPGDFVKMDETVLEIATDKVDSEVPSTAEGVITEILFKENDVVAVGKVIARISADAQVGAAPASAPSPAPTPVPASAPTPAPAAPVASHQAASGGGNKFYSPLVLNIASSEGIAMSELENIQGIGEKTIQTLLSTLGSVKKIVEASDETLINLCGEHRAKLLRAYFDLKTTSET